jgi:2-polyprenyl-6-methoxyphenol hydroxylase-like FAD-dependent oxidoreductase
MLLADKEIAIVGAGPGGLTLARLLQLKGATVKVYERDKDKHARVQGSPLDMHEDSGLAVIRAAGLLKEFQKCFMAGADRTVITDHQADIFYSDHETKKVEDFGDAYFRPEIDRGVLRQLLLDALQPGTVVWDSHFLKMEQRSEGWMLQFKDGRSAYADLVVAADGANSKIRPYLTDVKPFYSGILMLEGNVNNAEQAAPHIHALIKGGKIMAFGNKKNLLLGQKGNGELGFYASFKAEESWSRMNGLDYNDKDQLVAWFRQEYSDWNIIWQELFEKSELPFIPRPIYCMPPDQQWKTRANLTMLGDAAHVMPPFAGEGANMAMLDALELSECLTSDKYPSIGEAISTFEFNMNKRAAVAAQESLANGELMHSETALADMLEMFSQH